MTKTQPPAEHSTAIEALRHRAREPYQIPRALQRLRHRITRERERSHRRILETVAERAQIDLHSIYEEARRRNATKRRLVTRTLAALESEAAERARAQKAEDHRIRGQYLDAFGKQLAAHAGKTELKFRNPVDWSSDVTVPECSYISGGGWCWDPDLGTWEASAEIVPNAGGTGMWLHPRINADTGDCDDSWAGVTIQDLTYRMGPPAASFGITDIRVDLLSNGIASSVLGDPGWFSEASQYYEHSSVSVDVYIAQQVNGEWQQWPLLSEKLFVGKADYVTQIRALLSGQAYPANLLIRSADVGGGDLLCHLQIVCSALAIGADGRVRIDFGAGNEHGIFVGGVALLGDFV